MLIAVNYHYVRPLFDHPFPGIQGITPDQFESQLDLLSQAGTFVALRDVVRAYRGQSELPERAILVTFDDGLREQFDYALPILLRRRIPALFFASTAPLAERRVLTVHQIHLLRSVLSPSEFETQVTLSAEVLGIDLSLPMDEDRIRWQYPYDDFRVARCKFLLNKALPWRQTRRLIQRCFERFFRGRECSLVEEFYMDRLQLTQLAELDYLGSHCHDHLSLGQLPTSEQRSQVHQSVQHLYRWTRRHVAALSYPYGSKAASPCHSAEWLTSLGIHAAFTMERSGNLSMTSPHYLGRLDCNDAPGGKGAVWDVARLFDELPVSSWHEECTIPCESYS